MSETEKQSEATPESVGLVAALTELSKSCYDQIIDYGPIVDYDPIADAEESGRAAYFDGYSLSDAIESKGIDTDTDEGMAFVIAFRNAASEPLRPLFGSTAAWKPRTQS